MSADGQRQFGAVDVRCRRWNTQLPVDVRKYGAAGLADSRPCREVTMPVEESRRDGDQPKINVILRFHNQRQAVRSISDAASMEQPPIFALGAFTLGYWH